MLQKEQQKYLDQFQSVSNEASKNLRLAMQTNAARKYRMSWALALD